MATSLAATGRCGTAAPPHAAPRPICTAVTGTRTAPSLARATVAASSAGCHGSAGSVVHHYDTVSVTVPEGSSVHDVTALVRDVVRASGVTDGTVTVSSMHTTVGVTVNEAETRLFDDIRGWLRTLAPPDAPWLHKRGGGMGAGQGVEGVAGRLPSAIAAGPATPKPPSPPQRPASARPPPRRLAWRSRRMEGAGARQRPRAPFLHVARQLGIHHYRRWRADAWYLAERTGRGHRRRGRGGPAGGGDGQQRAEAGRGRTGSGEAGLTFKPAL